MPILGADLVAKNKYVWRGMVFNDEYVFWPDVWINWYGLTICGWGSFDLTDVKDKQMEITDLAFFLDYSRSFGPATATIGYAHYTYPGSAYGPGFSTTGEVYGKVGAQLKVAQASVGLNYDVKQADGFYLSPKVSRSQTFGIVTPTLSVSLGYADKKHNLYYFGVGKGGLTDLTGALTLSIAPPAPLGNFMTISADLNYAIVIDEDLADAVNVSSKDRNFWFGVGINLFHSLGGK
ncbi:MAG: hypothetical protein ABIL05_00545 [candidate division WOR-3 bacterium]